MKLVVSNPQDGKTYQKEVEANQSKLFYGKKIKDTVKGTDLGMEGYELQITGGSDKQGFPMRSDLHGTARKKLLLAGGVGLKKVKKGERQRKSVRGNTVSEEVVQLNLKVVKAGKDGLAKIMGKAPAEEEKKEEAPKEKPKTEKKEEKKAEEKPKAEEKKE